MATSIPFSEDQSKHPSRMITPLGAAIVEAMPDRKRMAYIKARFKKKRQCPVSKLFTAEELVSFYKEEGLLVVAVPSGKE